ncbi:hypothetical protein [Alienimonas chondri]|uniref:Glycosyltransferase RgtA/B/C/D-like domain-containing protein n=1 Tax=Alienimonas chondri TaxID=2681879 RepID=A0ABX1VAV4_9PLAN|nr:hypothetical protein [Alienimonas chondri]NNJ24422.1 hypothetical protein [Alienimonas chondri]
MNSRVAAVVVAGLLAATLATTAARPLYHSDVWAHLAYGRQVRAAGEVPATEPLMPLCEGVPFVNFAWLAGVAGSLLYDAAGPEGLRLAGGLLVAITVGLFGVAARKRGRVAWAGILAGTAFLAIAWFQLFAFAPWVDPLGPQILRPQTIGVALFAGLTAVTPIPRRPGWRWLGLPIVFALWTNLHGSWPIGLVWLAADWLDRAGRLRGAAWRSDRVRRGAGLIALCAAACCLNPLGPGAFVEALTFGRHPNLEDVIEWGPLTWAMNQTWVFVVAAALTAIAALLSPRRIGWGEALLLVTFGLAACRTSRWLLWWAGPAAISLAAHLSAFSQRPRPAAGSAARPAHERRWWIGAWAVGLVIGTAASVPTWRIAAGQYAGAGCLAHGTPVRATAYLREHPPAGQVFNAHAFGDFLLLAGPPNVRIFVGSHAHLTPPTVWNDALAISRADPGWKAKLDRYDATTLMLSVQDQRRLISEASASPRWREVYRDGTAVIFDRVQPMAGP